MKKETNHHSRSSTVSLKLLCKRICDRRKQNELLNMVTTDSCSPMITGNVKTEKEVLTSVVCFSFSF